MGDWTLVNKCGPLKFSTEPMLVVVGDEGGLGRTLPESYRLGELNPKPSCSLSSFTTHCVARQNLRDVFLFLPIPPLLLAIDLLQGLRIIRPCDWILPLSQISDRPRNDHWLWRVWKRLERCQLIALKWFKERHPPVMAPYPLPPLPELGSIRPPRHTL